MTARRDLMNLVGFGVDDDGDVWIWTDHPSGFNWTVTVRQKWEGIATSETPRRVADLDLDIFGVVEWGEEGDLSVVPVEWVQPLSAWLVDRARVVSIEIDFGNGTLVSWP